MMERFRLQFRCLLALVLLLSGAPALGSERALVLEPQSGRGPELQGQEAAGDTDLAQELALLGEVVREAARDLGLRVEREAPTAQDSWPLSALVREAKGRWVVAPRLVRRGHDLHLKLIAVAPDSEVVRIREAVVPAKELALRAPVMLDELVSSAIAPEQRQALPLPASDPGDEVAAPPSSGRAVLALNAALFGGYVGFSAHRASDPEDRRLLYPLTALGAGLGLGASMLVADEWDVSQGDAWFISAGMVWPASAGLILATHYASSADRRHTYSLGAAGLGLSLAGIAVALDDRSPGQAAMVHSAGAFGLFLGGVTEAIIEGGADSPPRLGMGYGSLIGVVGLGVLSTQVEANASRVLMIDLGAGLGALVGAAAGSPLLFVGDGPTEGRTRAWWATIGAGTLLGGGLALLWTGREAPESALPNVLPYAGYMGETGHGETGSSPAFGLGLRGTW